MRAVSIGPDAEDELLEAVEWLDLQKPGLGSRLLDEVELVCEQIARFPFSSPTIHGDVHRILLREFPYAALYVVDGESITVVAFFHVRRRPPEP